MFPNSIGTFIFTVKSYNVKPLKLISNLNTMSRKRASEGHLVIT